MFGSVYLTSKQIYTIYNIKIEAYISVNRNITPQTEKVKQLVMAGALYYASAPHSPPRDSAYQVIKNLSAEGYHLLVERY